MASGSGRSVGEQPPVLPAKQHRHSSVESDCVLSPAGFLQQNYGCNEVFTEPTDCHADQCPIHQRYDYSKHQERFFSDVTPPPPVPKKKLTRTLSLPVCNAPLLSPLSPLSTLQRHIHDFDNPVYMMAPIPDLYIHDDIEDRKTSRGNSVSLLPFSQISFETPDEHLSSIFGDFVDPCLVSERVQHRHLLFLRSLVQSVEDQSLFRVPQRDISSLQPRDVLLCEGDRPKLVGDKTYYSLHNPKFPERVLALRVLSQTDEAPSVHNQPLHVNVQNVVAHFQPGVLLKSSSSRMHDPPESDSSSCEPTGGSSTEEVSGSPNCPPTVETILQRGHGVSVERDLPHATLEDFVQESCSLKITQCQHYDKQVCVLLLQVLMGLHHLHSIAAAAELRPQQILLVWPSWGRQKGEDDPQGQSGKKEEAVPVGKRGRVQMMWKKYGSPRVVLMPQSSAFDAPQSRTSTKSKIRDLIQFCLHPPEGLRPSNLALFKSSYQRGLLHLSSLLQSESGPQMTDIIVMLQVLLWGPQVSLFSHRGSLTSTVQNWLTVKRAMMVMKLAERRLLQDQPALDWEDCICLKYLSFTDSETVAGVATQLWNGLPSL
ncbi:inactive tyrosine-protein kinase PEAK1 isoform X2 [Nothobranchius furzeri]|uniref:Pseudopodium-enriched atypical kinase 1-like n=2 Tax=Nothobranchius furzeri TaxID=105023 RepID=A0A9D3BDR9_NOTFU|nr:pseudopodium-enriched atypical kinase 1-like [Nothobranchius furzeri]